MLQKKKLCEARFSKCFDFGRSHESSRGGKNGQDLIRTLDVTYVPESGPSIPFFFLCTRPIPETEGLDLPTLEIKLESSWSEDWYQSSGGWYVQAASRRFLGTPTVERTQNDTFLYWTKYDVPKQNLLNRTGRLFRYGIGYIFCPRLNWSWRSIPFGESVLGTPAFVFMSWRRVNQRGRDILYPSRLSTYPTEIYDPSKPIFTTLQKVPWATLKLFNWKPSLCAPMLDFHHVQSWFPETLIGSGLNRMNSHGRTKPILMNLTLSM